MRAKILKDKVSALNQTREEGIQQGKLEVSHALLDILDDETIALKAGLSIEQVAVLGK